MENAPNYVKHKHISERLFNNLLTKVNHYTGCINIWIEENHYDSSYITKSLIGIINNAKREYPAIADPFLFLFFYKGDNLPSILTLRPNMTGCQDAYDMLFFHLILLDDLISIHEIPLSCSNSEDADFLKYDDWFVDAVVQVNDLTYENPLSNDISPSDILPQDLYNQIKPKALQKINHERATRFYHATNCPICAKILACSLRNERSFTVKRITAKKLFTIKRQKDTLINNLFRSRY